MAFKPIKWDDGRVTEVKMVASATVAKFDALDEDGNGFFQRATSSSTDCHYVALEGKTDDGTNQLLLVVPTYGVLFEADTNAAPVQTDVGTYADLTDHDTLNESASSNGVFKIEEIVGAAGDQKVRGYFIQDVS